MADSIKRRLAALGVKTLYIEPSAPWETAYLEIFISHSGEELLEREVFANLKEAKVSAKATMASNITACNRSGA